MEQFNLDYLLLAGFAGACGGILLTVLRHYNDSESGVHGTARNIFRYCSSYIIIGIFAAIIAYLVNSVTNDLAGTLLVSLLSGVGGTVTLRKFYEADQAQKQLRRSAKELADEIDEMDIVVDTLTTR